MGIVQPGSEESLATWLRLAALMSWRGEYLQDGRASGDKRREGIAHDVASTQPGQLERAGAKSVEPTIGRA
jgi:hypothetical protein